MGKYYFQTDEVHAECFTKCKFRKKIVMVGSDLCAECKHRKPPYTTFYEENNKQYIECKKVK